jgi:drug/metabolite transporter (DMT)-like permease
VAASFSAILIRYASGADPLAISFWRCAAGAALLLPALGLRVQGVSRREISLAVVAGLFLALHFATWITSVRLTTIAASVLLVSTTPVFTAAAGRVLFGERLGWSVWGGIALALAGTAVVAGQGAAGSSLAGNGLALAGGAAAAGYVLAGGAVRRRLGIFHYAVLAYGSAALVLLALCLAAGTPLWGYGAKTWWAIGGIVIGPQLLGHTVINFVLRDVDATSVAVTVMAEPVVATALAFILFGEAPSWLVYPGGVAVLAGIYFVTAARRLPEVPPE